MEYKFDGKTDYFVISDLHGQGKIFDCIFNHFDQEALRLKQYGKKIVIVINGDIIDRGNDSIRMLVDIMDRVKKRKGNLEVVMLPGNHEEMMLSALEYYIKNGHHDNSGKTTVNNVWFAPENYGVDTFKQFCKLTPNKRAEVIDFLRSLPLFFRVKSDVPDNNSYCVVHALPPRDAMGAPRIPTLGQIVSDPRCIRLRDCLTYRKEPQDPNINLPDKNVITIIGHTPVESPRGFSIEENGKLLMIDGGCAYMAQNPDSLILQEMATLVHLSDVPGETHALLYGDEKTKYLREGRKVK